LIPGKRHRLDDVARRGSTAGVAIVDKRWKCGHCDAALAPTALDWKSRIEPRRRALAALFEQTNTQLRGREQQPVYLNERYCPDCGSCLSADIEVSGAARVPPGFSFRGGDTEVKVA
jgi:ribosomal protein S27AE